MTTTNADVLFSGDWAKMRNFITGAANGALYAAIGKQVDELAFQVRDDLRSRIMNNGTGLYGHPNAFAPIAETTYKLRSRLLGGTTTRGLFPARTALSPGGPGSYQAVYFSGVYAESIIVDRKLSGTRGEWSIQVDPKAIHTYTVKHQDGSTRSYSINMAQLANILEWGSAKRRIPARLHWTHTYLAIESMPAFRDLMSGEQMLKLLAGGMGFSGSLSFGSQYPERNRTRNFVAT